MNKGMKSIVASLLALSGLMLGVMVPGGPIETRSFSNIQPVILGIFNIFLTALGLFSLVLIYFVLKEKRWSFVASTICGASYLAVYLLDLGKIFPVSPNPMPATLMTLEIVASIISLPLIATSIQEVQKTRNNDGNDSALQIKGLIFIVGMLILVGIGIVIFATNAAMH